MKKITFVLILLFTNSIFAQLEFSLKLEKEVYRQGEPIISLLYLKNASNTAYTYTHDWNVHCAIIRKDGVEIRNTCFWGPTGHLIDITLNPGEYDIYPDPISAMLGKIEIDELMTKIFLPGNYSLQEGYRNLLIDGKDTLRNEVFWSNEIYFKVVEPDSDYISIFNDLKNLIPKRFEIGADEYSAQLKKRVKEKPEKETDYLYVYYYLRSLGLKPHDLIYNYPDVYCIAKEAEGMLRKYWDTEKTKNGTVLHDIIFSNLISLRELKKYYEKNNLKWIEIDLGEEK